MRPMRVTEVVDAAVNVCRANWKPFAAIVAFVMVPLQFVQQLLTRGSYQSFPMSFDPSTSASTAPSTGVLAVSLVLSLVVLLVIRPFLTAAMIRAISAAYLSEAVDVGEAYRFALRRFGSILWVLVLEIAAWIGAAIGLVALGAALVALHVVPLLVLIVIGAVVLLVIVYVRWVLATAAVVVEDARGTKALGRSWGLTRGAFGRVFGTLLLSGLLASIVGGIVGAIPTVLSLTLPAGWVLRAIGGVLSAIITTPFVTAVTVLLYFDARIRREGLDIALMLREIVTRP
jgi:hypothetical protein